MNRTRLATLGLLLALIIIPVTAQGNDATLQLTISRDFGFSLGGRIQGKFTLKAEGPENLTHVEFLIDDVVVSTDRERPFRYSFNTGEHDLGVHHISAVGYTSLEEVLHSPVRKYEFVSVEEGLKGATGIVVPILIGTIVLVVIAAVSTVLVGRKGGRPRIGDYGPAGGAVCSRCELPFGRHVLSPNLLIGKVERCPHCGKWAIVRRASREALEKAEARWVDDEARGGLDVESEEDKLRRMIDDSRFES
ncbi:MAG: hypothetical protein JSV37_06225 [Anaerolineaceae bacterium]|nr:MAG: hypothetical protein JSV37_06225 [Anaerolineaceae bacterium]